MSRYDEDLYENPFFVALEKKCPKLFEEATVKRWIVCVPQFSMVTKDDLQDEDFKDHILVPTSMDLYHTVSKHEVTIKQQIIELGKGFEKTKKVEILFEETFYNNSDESYRVLCVSEFFNREPEASLSNEASTGGALVKQPVTYEDYMKLLWTNTGSKTKDHLDKLLNTFCSAYEKFEEESIPSLVDFVSAQLTRAMQVVLKDPSVKRAVKLSDAYMAQLKIAVEMYMMNITHKRLFSTITACMKSEDAEVNKMTRNLKLIRLKQLGVRKEFEENIPAAKIELAKLNKFSTPLGRLFCLKKVVAALTKPLKKSTGSEDLLMTTDDFLPLLIYLIIKSETPNWTANLMYMKHFHQAKIFEDDEFSFYLATTEAALDYLCSGKIKLENTEPVQKKAKTSENEDNHSFKRQGSGGASSTKDKFFQYVQYGDEAAVTLMLRSSEPSTTDVLSRLCHPLCTCEKCSEIISRNKHSTDMVSPFSRDDMGHTALHIAANYGQAKLIDILIQHGALPDASDYLGCTPLHLAAQKGYQNIILLLVHFGSDISAVDNEGNTPLHMCAMNGHEDCVKAILFLDILKNRLNVNARNDMGNTPLHLASKWGYEGIVKFLLDTEADPRIRNRKRQTPLNLAQNSVIKRELQLAFDNLPPIIVTHKEDQKPTHPKPPPQPPPTPHQPSDNTTNKKDSTEAQPNQKPQGFEVVDVHPVMKPALALVDNPSSDATSLSTPEVASLDTYDLREVERLFKAIKDKDLPLIKYYLNWSDSSLETPDSPSPEGTLCHPLCQCAKCQSLQKKGSSNLGVNCQNKKGFSPLHISIIERNTEAFQLFLRKGAKVNIQTNKHITPLHLACYHCDRDIVKMLIESGANVNSEDMHGEIALHLAAAKKDAEIAKFLIEHSSLVNLPNRDGNTPLHHASNVDSLDVAKVLLSEGAEVGILNKNSEVPADLAKSEEMKTLLMYYIKPLRKSKSLDVKDLQPKNSSDSEKPKVNVKDLFAALEKKDLPTLKELTSSIKSFDKEKSLKRSKTFDRSALTLDLIKIPMSIKHFDTGSLKHVDSVDKSTPMHIYSLLRSDSSYFNYLETPGIDVSQDITKQLPELDSLSAEELLRKDNPLDAIDVLPEKDSMNVQEDDVEEEIHLKESKTEIEKIQESQFSDKQTDGVNDNGTNGSQVLLSGSYVVVQDSAGNRNSMEGENSLNESGQIIEACDNKDGSTVDSTEVPYSEQKGSLCVDSLSNLTQSVSNEINTEKSLNELVASYDDVNRDIEFFQGKDLEIPSCSTLTTKQTVTIDASQLKASDSYCDKQSNIVYDDQTETADTSNLTVSQTMNSVILTDSTDKAYTNSSYIPKKAAEHDFHVEEKSTQDTVILEDAATEDIQKVIAEALTETVNVEQVVKEIPKSGSFAKEKSDLSVLTQVNVHKDVNNETKDMSDIIDNLTSVNVTESNSLT